MSSRVVPPILPAALPPSGVIVSGAYKRGGVKTGSTVSIKTPQTNPHGAPVVRNSGRLLRVREVAELLSVSKATVYSLIDRHELERIWVGTSIRVPSASLDAFVGQNQR